MNRAGYYIDIKTIYYFQDIFIVLKNLKAAQQLT